MDFLNEFVSYAIKYVLLGAIAFAGIIAGVYYKKNKLAKEAAAEKDSDSKVTE